MLFTILFIIMKLIFITFFSVMLFDKNLKVGFSQKPATTFDRFILSFFILMIIFA